jgi:hypothetical protein
MTEEPPIALSEQSAALITKHCERTGLTRAAAIEDLLARGAQQVDLRAVRGMLEEVRAYVIDTLHAVDAAGPYAIAALELMAHWSTQSGAARLSESEYAEAARDAGRANWDGHLAARNVAIPSRPVSEQPSSAFQQEP